MINQIDNALWHKTNAALRLGLVKGALNAFGDRILVNEYPKSGGSWPAKMIADATELTCPTHRLPKLGPCVLHGHYLTGTNIPKTVYVWRDGRDIAVSWYYHFVVGNQYTKTEAVDVVRQQAGITDPQNIEESFPRALSYFLQSPRHPRYTWASFVDRWADSQHLHVKYEDLKSDPVAELQRLAIGLTGAPLEDMRAQEIVETHSFSRQAKRKPGEEDSKQYLRKGIVGDWKNHFTAETREMFAKHAGAQLIKLGYEKNDDWVKETQ